MDQTNLDIYGHAPLPWSRAADQLDAAVGQNVTHFLATVRRDGRRMSRVSAPSGSTASSTS